jgi:Domain of unknown function (DUF4410)
MRALPFTVLAALAVSGGAISAQQDTKPSPPPQQQAADAPANPAPAAEAEVDRSTIVYVTDFELEAAKAKDEKPGATSTPAGGAEAEPKTEAKTEEPATERAHAIVNFMALTLVKELQKAGYKARRLRPEDTRPDSGIRIQGVFAETDEENHVRRMVLGGGPTVGDMSLYVGIGNLAKPDQALYAIAPVKGSSDKPGPVITVTSYAPVAKFEMPKNVTEQAVQDTAVSIVNNLTILLNANAAALGQ